MLAQAEHDVLTKNLRQLIDCFPYQSLIDEIFSNKILNCTEFREIDGKLTREEKNKALFDTIKSKPPGTFKLICQLYSKVRSVQYIQGQELLQQLEKHPGNHEMEVVKDSKRKLIHFNAYLVSRIKLLLYNSTTLNITYAFYNLIAIISPHLHRSTTVRMLMYDYLNFIVAD